MKVSAVRVLGKDEEDKTAIVAKVVGTELFESSMR